MIVAVRASGYPASCGGGSEGRAGVRTSDSTVLGFEGYGDAAAALKEIQRKASFF